MNSGEFLRIKYALFSRPCTTRNRFRGVYFTATRLHKLCMFSATLTRQAKRLLGRYSSKRLCRAREELVRGDSFHP